MSNLQQMFSSYKQFTLPKGEEKQLMSLSRRNGVRAVKENTLKQVLLK